MVGDGECNEGAIWEGAHVAQRYGLDNLVAVVDENQLQQFCWRDTTPVERRRARPRTRGNELARRWAAFGWQRDRGRRSRHGRGGRGSGGLPERMEGVPVALVAHTVKGKGVSFMENDFPWHSRVPTDGRARPGAGGAGRSGRDRPVAVR